MSLLRKRVRLQGGFIPILITRHRSRIKSAEDAIEKARSQIDLRKAENYGRLSVEVFLTKISDRPLA